MFSQILSIFLSVVIPVFAVVALGYLLGPRLKIQYQTLSRTAYYLLLPAFVFDVMSRITIDLSTAGRMVITITLIYVATGIIGASVARLIGGGPEMAVAFLMTGVFGNVGNYGLALSGFRFGEGAMESTTLYMVTVNMVAFTVCVLAAGWVRQGGYSALKSLLRTPGFVVLPIALLFPAMDSVPPLMISRIASLLGGALIPVMLLTLGLQLREAKGLRWDLPVFAASGVRLILGPVLAFTLVPFMGLEGIEASTGILMASMPAAVLTSIIAIEHDLLPDFVISVVCVTTLASLLTLTLVMVLV